MGRERDDDISVLVEHFAFPVFAVTPRGAVRPVNAVARRIVGGGPAPPWLRLFAHGRLAEPLRRLLAESGGENGGCLARRVELGEDGEAVDVLAIDGGDGCRLVVVLDPRVLRPPDPGLLAGWLGLTRREAEVAAHVACGLSLAETARLLGIGVGTARNHLKAAFHKVGVSGQARLAALLVPAAVLSSGVAEGEKTRKMRSSIPDGTRAAVPPGRE